MYGTPPLWERVPPALRGMASKMVAGEHAEYAATTTDAWRQNHGRALAARGGRRAAGASRGLGYAVPHQATLAVEDCASSRRADKLKVLALSWIDRP